MTYVQMPGGLAAPPLSTNGLLRALADAQARAIKANPARQRLSAADAIAADYIDGMRQAANAQPGQHAHAHAAEVMMRAVGRPEVLRIAASDAVGGLPNATTYVDGAPIRPLLRPVRLLESLPKAGLPNWTEIVRHDYVEHTGSVVWGRGSPTIQPRADYATESYYDMAPEIVWTAAETPWRQTLTAQAPGYGFSPQAERAAAAREVIEQALENAIISQPAGTSLLGLQETPCLRERSALTYGTSNTEDCLSDFTRFLQSVSQLSLGLLKPNAMAISQRILDAVFRQYTTSSGFPIDSIAVIENAMSRYGINKIVIAPSLQDYGATNVDAAVLYNDGSDGLKFYEAMPFTAVRSQQVALSDVTYYAAIVGGLFARYRASTLVYEVTVVPV